LQAAGEKGARRIRLVLDVKPFHFDTSIQYGYRTHNDQQVAMENYGFDIPGSISVAPEPIW
jgi:hypothetical protein